MKLPKYTVCRSNGKWIVSNGRKVLASFEWKPEAEDYVQSLVEADNWNAANRD